MEVDPKELQALRNQMTFLQQKIKILEDSDKPDVSAEKAQLRYLFQQFSSNGGSSLTAAEFQKFLTVLAGQPFSNGEVQDLLKEINRAEGDSTESVTFIPFYSLWTRQGAVFSVAEQKLNNTKQLLLSGMGRKSFSRAIHRFFARTKRNLDPLNNETAEVHIRARSAEFADAKCAVGVKYHEDPVMAGERRLALKVPATEDAETAMIFSFSFCLKPGVDEFALGEIAGSIKDLLALAKEELGNTFHNVQMASENGVRVFRVAVSFGGENELLDMIKSALNEAKVEALNGRVEFSHPLSFETDASSTERLATRVSLDARASNVYVDLIQQAINAEEEKKRSHLRRARAQKKKDPFMESINFLRVLQNVEVNVNLDAFARAFLQSYEDEETIGTMPLGWNAVRKLLAKNILEAYADPSIPPLVFDTFFNTIANLGDLHSITVQFGDNVYVVSCENLPVLTLLPTKKQLKELQNALDKKKEAAEAAQNKAVKAIRKPAVKPAPVNNANKTKSNASSTHVPIIAKPSPAAKSATPLRTGLKEMPHKNLNVELEEEDSASDSD